MLLSKFYEYLDLPEKSFLGSRVAKKQLIENSKLSTADKKAVQEDIESIVWRNTLKNSTVNISPYFCEVNSHDANGQEVKAQDLSPEAESYILEYSEIALIEVTIRSEKRVKKIAELIQRAIPYPLILVLHLKHVTPESESTSLFLNLATKRLSKADNSKLKVERFYHTQAFTNELLTQNSISEKFFKSLSVNNQSFINFYEFYMGWVKQFIALEKSKLTDSFEPEASHSVDIEQAKVQAQTLDSIASLEAKLSSVRQKIKQENQINRKVELNIQAQKIKQELAQLTAELS